MLVDADPRVPGVQANADLPLFATDTSTDVVVQTTSLMGGFEFDIVYDNDVLQYLGWTRGPFLGSTGRTVNCHEIIHERDVRIGCTTDGPPPPPGVTGSGVVATLHMRPLAIGETCLLLLIAGTSEVTGDAITTSGQDACLRLTPDSDGDGCADGQESGVDAQIGGDRDPTSSWDFYDVPSPALSAAFPNAERDRSISLNDAAATLIYFGTTADNPSGVNSNGVGYGTDWNTNGVADGREYDRSPGLLPAKPWRSGPPNDAVSLQDVALVLLQFGHTCSIGA
jgi:hypothetical protein